MVSISDLDGWSGGGAFAGESVHKVLGTNEETGAVLLIKINGPTEFRSTSYDVVVQKPGAVFPEVYVAQGVKSEMDAEIEALQYAKENRVP